MLDLSDNYLENRFAVELSNLLRENKVIYEVDISNTKVSEKGASMLRDVLAQYNNTLVSLGNLQTYSQHWMIGANTWG